MHFQPLLAALALAGAAQAGFYTKNSPVLQVDAKNYDRLIAKSNHTSVRLHPFPPFLSRRHPLPSRNPH